jgi:RNA polymerase sigma-70 factor, ECF subfamily
VATDDFEALWTAQYWSVTRTAYLITGDVEEAKDCAQEAFVRALQRWPKVRALDRPESWVHRVATNLAISTTRRRRPRGRTAADPVLQPDPPDEDLRRALLSLTRDQRAVVALRFYLDWSVEDVAAALGKAPGTVRAVTHQAMERLRTSVREDVIDDGQ